MFLRSKAVLAVGVLVVLAALLPSSAVAADFSRGGVLFYQAGVGGDAVWSDPTGTVATSVSGTYTPVIGDFVGDSAQDVLWYGRGSASDWLWEYRTDGTHIVHSVTINGTYYMPLVGRFKLDADTGSDLKDDIFWYFPGLGSESLWDFENDGSITKTSGKWINGTYKPVVGKFAQTTDPGVTYDVSDDILWFKPGGESTLWDFNSDGTTSKTAWDLGPDATPLTLYLPNPVLFLYRPGSPSETMVDFVSGGIRSFSVNGTYQPIVGLFAADHSNNASSIIWYAPGSTPDPQWDWNGTTFVNGPVRSVTGTYTPFVSLFTPEPGDHQILWVPAGGGPSPLWTFVNGAVADSTANLPTGVGTPYYLGGFQY